jgi:hypothetical protein
MVSFVTKYNLRQGILTLHTQSSDVSYCIMFPSIFLFFPLPVLYLFSSMLYMNAGLLIFRSKNKGACYTQVKAVFTLLC